MNTNQVGVFLTENIGWVLITIILVTFLLISIIRQRQPPTPDIVEVTIIDILVEQSSLNDPDGSTCTIYESILERERWADCYTPPTGQVGDTFFIRR